MIRNRHMDPDFASILILSTTNTATNLPREVCRSIAFAPPPVNTSLVIVRNSLTNFDISFSFSYFFLRNVNECQYSRIMQLHVKTKLTLNSDEFLSTAVGNTFASPTCNRRTDPAVRHSCVFRTHLNFNMISFDRLG